MSQGKLMYEAKNKQKKKKRKEKKRRKWRYKIC